MLYVWGPAGIGKTSLLDEMARLAERHSVACTRFDARLLGTSTSDGGNPLWQLQKNRARQVVLFDQFEQLESLEPWLRKQLLPSLPRETLVVLASRRQPSLDWTLHGWSSFMRVLELTELTESDARDLLARRGVAARQHAAALRNAGGSPLQLALACDVFDQSTVFHCDDLERPGIAGLAAALLGATSGDPRRHRALGLCAVARFTTLELLEREFPRSTARELYAWIERLSFVRESPRGLVPHPLVRRSILDELRRHHPSAYLAFERELRAFYAYKSATDDDRGAWVLDRMWLDRDVSGISPYLDPHDGEMPTFTRAASEHHPRILELIEQHEGTDSARIAAQWLGALPHSFEIHQGPTEPVSAMLSMVVLARDMALTAKVADPLLELASRHARSRVRFSEGESAILFRYCLTARAHQAPCPELNLLLTQTAKRLAEHQRLAFFYCAVAEPDRWIELARSCGLLAEKLGPIGARWREITLVAVDFRARSFIDVFTRWAQTNASELVGRAWQLATTRPMRAAPVYGSAAVSDMGREPLLTTDPEDDRRALEELLEERVERLAAAAKLSPRERQVLNFVLLGRHAEDIASVIAIAPRTARLHLSHLLTKLGAESRLDVFRVLS
jgi:DNA-binding CsgD family transcriptional regulator